MQNGHHFGQAGKVHEHISTEPGRILLFQNIVFRPKLVFIYSGVTSFVVYMTTCGT